MSNAVARKDVALIFSDVGLDGKVAFSIWINSRSACVLTVDMHFCYCLFFFYLCNAHTQQHCHQNFSNESNYEASQKQRNQSENYIRKMTWGVHAAIEKEKKLVFIPASTPHPYIWRLHNGGHPWSLQWLAAVPKSFQWWSPLIPTAMWGGGHLQALHRSSWNLFKVEVRRGVILIYSASMYQ